MERQGNIIARNTSGIWAEFGGLTCHGCHAGCKQATRRILIPADHSHAQQHGFSPINQEQILLSMANSNLAIMLFRALMLPLCGFVTGAIVADLLALAEVYVFVGAASGLLIMIGFSRAISIATLQAEVTVASAA